MQNPDGSFAIVGYTTSETGDFENNHSGGLLILQTDPEGFLKWTKIIDNGTGNSLILSPRGDYILTGRLLRENKSGSNIFLAKVDPEKTN